MISLVFLTSFLPVVAIVLMFFHRGSGYRFYAGLSLLLLFFVLRSINEIFVFVRDGAFFVSYFNLLWILGMFFMVKEVSR